MSMKRSRKAGTSTRTNETEGGAFAFGQMPTTKSWDELVADKPDKAFKPYAMSTAFVRNDLVDHPKFGRGVVVLVEGSRVEVLFKEGSKKLAHAG
jgi:hypothetical protein